MDEVIDGRQLANLKIERLFVWWLTAVSVGLTNVADVQQCIDNW